VGDETAVPAIGAITEQLPEGVTAHVFVEVPQRSDLTELVPPARGTLTVLERGTAQPGSLLVPTVGTARVPQPVYAWVAGVKEVVTEGWRS